jgi:hypothetical protein
MAARTSRSGVDRIVAGNIDLFSGLVEKQHRRRSRGRQLEIRPRVSVHVRTPAGKNHEARSIVEPLQTREIDA